MKARFKKAVLLLLLCSFAVLGVVFCVKESGSFSARSVSGSEWNGESYHGNSFTVSKFD